MALALMIFLAFCLPLFSAGAEETGKTTCKVVLRKSADQDSKALQTLPQGEEVALLDATKDWYKVNYGKYTGYILKKYVKVSKNSVVANATKIDALGDPPAAMKIGNSGDDVTKLQKALDILGFYEGRIDGEYGDGTTAAVMAYQKEKGLKADGVAGRDTVKSIFGAVGKDSPKSEPASTSVSKSVSTSEAKESRAEDTVETLAQIGTAPGPSKEGDSGTKVKKLQQALECLGYYVGDIDGDYGAKTVTAVKKFQKNRGMKQDGVAGSSTLRVLFGSQSESPKSSAKSAEPSTKTEVKDWFADDMTRVIPKNAKFTIKDVRTGKTFRAVRWSGINHLDAEPATSEDTALMKKIFGGAWSWNRRPILIQYNGHVYAASMNGMPHGTTTINNGFEGHFCIHFQNSKTHGSEKVDADHQKALSTASKATW